jgi:8-oxo-dGTP pyrophosphatase MutT (NUDIX family)
VTPDDPRHAKRVGILPRQYMTGENWFKDKVFRWLSAMVMRIVLGNFVLACVDIIVYRVKPDGAIWVLLPKRREQPHADTWVSSGGRRRPGRLLEEEAALHCRNDLCIEIDPSRLQRIGTYELLWDTRPKDFGPGGCHGTTNVLGYRLSDEEEPLIRLDGDNVGAVLGSSWCLIDGIIQDGEAGGVIHPALIDMLADLRDLLRKQ